MIIQIGTVLLTTEIFTEEFCCDLAACHGACCVEGDAGAPLELDEVALLEDVLPQVMPRLSDEARQVIRRQGVAYTDIEGDLVTSLVAGRDCAFALRDADGCCLCAAEAACREGRTHWPKPISCALYPLREKRFKNGTTGLQYHRWPICQSAVKKGRELHLPLYRFLREPLIRRFGQEWYDELCQAARQCLQELAEHTSRPTQR